MRTYNGKILKDVDGIFVFGSNTEGKHGKGAAKWAKDYYGAIYGQSFGRQGQSFAIITKDLNKKKHPSIKRGKIVSQILYLYLYAIQHPELDFYIAYSGLSKNLNGYDNREMASMFFIESLDIPKNIIFEENFAKFIPIRKSNIIEKTKWANVYKNKYDVYMGRAGRGHDGYFGNPIKLKKGDAPGSTLEEYERYFLNRMLNDIEFKEKVLSLKGKTLGCFCKSQETCHVGVIIKYLEND